MPALSVWTYLLRYRRPIAVGVVLLLATNLLFLGIPWSMGRAVEALRGPDPAGQIPTYAALMIGFALATALTRIWSRTTIFNAGRSAEYDLRSDLFGHLLRLEPAYHQAHPTGDTMSRLTADMQTVRALWGAGVLNIINTGFAFASVLVMMLRIDPWLTLWAILPYPTLFFLGQIFGKLIFRASRDVQTRLGNLSSRLQEDLGGIQMIKTYGLEGTRRADFVASSTGLLAANMAMTRVRGQMVPILAALGSAGTIIVLWVGGRAVMRGEIDLGQLIEFSAYLARLVWPTLALGWMLSLWQRGQVSWRRVKELLAAQPRIRDGQATPPAAPRGALEVRGLSLDLGGRPILHDLDLTLAPGTITAVVGRTGSGKSTLADALCRLVEVPDGTIFLDGQDLNTLPLDYVHRTVGYAPQEAFLFSTTIADNIAMGYGGGTALPRGKGEELDKPSSPTAGPVAQAEPVIEIGPRIKSAAAAAGLDRDLAAMPEGIHTVVGERGITLSGGQRQRVALARALAGSPAVLILDDSLSSVDAATERIILQRLRTALAGKTALVISHRVAAIKDADQIVVLDAGRIVERGRHRELLAARGVYADLYASQLDPDELAAHLPAAEARG